jgi:hypothetical protein
MGSFHFFAFYHSYFHTFPLFFSTHHHVGSNTY